MKRIICGKCKNPYPPSGYTTGAQGTVRKETNMCKLKKEYKVYAQRIVEFEPPEENVIYPEVFIGTTFAVSESQAINNVRHRTLGDYGTSQYKPVDVRCHYTVWIDWRAELVNDRKAIKNRGLNEMKIPHKPIKRIYCGRCNCLFPLNSCEIRKCPHPDVKNKLGEYICVYCCKSCKFVYQQNTGFGCSYGKEVTK